MREPGQRVIAKRLRLHPYLGDEAGTENAPRGKGCGEGASHI
jgi:hypothetical protein